MMMRMEDVEAMKNTVLRMVSLMLALSLVGVGAIAEVTYSQDGSFSSNSPSFLLLTNLSAPSGTQWCYPFFPFCFPFRYRFSLR